MGNKKSSVALGIFDGVHLGHRAVIGAACAQRANGLEAAVFTFSPESVLRKTGGAAGYIYNVREKDIILTEEIAADCVYSPDFEELCGLSGQEFAQRILAEKMNAAHVCCGGDFRFGKNAACGADELRKFGEKLGFTTEIVESVELDGETVSSSRIRELLLDGDVEKAGELLGRPYFISAAVEDGNHIGRTIDFPTINQSFSPGQLVPRYGVYASSVNVGGKVLPAVTDIGVKPTVGGSDRPLAETHIIGYSGDLYGKIVDVAFRRFIRPEMRFGSLEELRRQIAMDAVNATAT
ncbi:MAG: riboflavin biosynthesis protein RibF [Ruminococcus sp.]|nr:riboflavin biosynthesis protein RibF [Ruminococcus sp.]